MDMEGELREGYIAKWNDYPEDEVKVRVARPSVLAPSKVLLAKFMATKKWFMEEDSEVHGNEEVARKYAWLYVDYDKRFREEIKKNSWAMSKLWEIKKLLRVRNVRLICYEKNPPCHRFILMKMIEEMGE